VAGGGKPCRMKQPRHRTSDRGIIIDNVHDAIAGQRWSWSLITTISFENYPGYRPTSH
jgi:hypothetical protein